MCTSVTAVGGGLASFSYAHLGGGGRGENQAKGRGEEAPIDPGVRFRVIAVVSL